LYWLQSCGRSERQLSWSFWVRNVICALGALPSWLQPAGARARLPFSSAAELYELIFIGLRVDIHKGSNQLIFRVAVHFPPLIFQNRVAPLADRIVVYPLTSTTQVNGCPLSPLRLAESPAALLVDSVVP
jgi:hypothetical protein